MLNLIQEIYGYHIGVSIYQYGDGGALVAVFRNSGMEVVDRVFGITPERILRRLAELDDTE